jgi:NAD+ kinase
LTKKPENPRKIGLIANFDKATACRAAVQRAAALIARARREVVADEQTAGLTGLKCATFPGVAALAREADLLLVFGGDGTMLHVVRESHGSGTPILGINIGRLGFLTAVSSNDLANALQKIWKKEYVIESRALIEASGQCQGLSTQMRALNDIVISHGAISRVIELDVYVDGQSLTRYRGDGLIVSTPTGSTAYSLSAGGPIISPQSRVLAITPICAHSVAHRSVIVSSDSAVQVKLLSRELETIISADGQIQANLCADDAITIRASRRSARLLHLGGSSFFATVRQKLHWSGSAV